MGLRPACRPQGSRDRPLPPSVCQALQEEIGVSGCKMRLSYLSSRTPGYKAVLRIRLTHPTIPFNLMKVHLMVAVEGRLFRKWFAAAPDLSYYFIWDKTDVYNQKVFGLSEAFGKPPRAGRSAVLRDSVRRGHMGRFFLRSCFLLLPFASQTRPRSSWSSGAAGDHHDLRECTQRLARGTLDCYRKGGQSQKGP